MKSMFLKVLLVIFLSQHWVFSQSNNNMSLKQQLDDYELGKRYLKLGNSWRESNDFDLALKFLKMGYNTLIRYNDKYQIGVYYEYMGYLYRDMDDLDKAIDYLKKAKKIFDVHAKLKNNNGSDKAVYKSIEKIRDFHVTEIVTKQSENDHSTIIQENKELKSKIAYYEKEIEDFNLIIDSLTRISMGSIIDNKKDSIDILTKTKDLDLNGTDNSNSNNNGSDTINVVPKLPKKRITLPVPINTK